jgi:hypothetical protein
MSIEIKISKESTPAIPTELLKAVSLDLMTGTRAHILRKAAQELSSSYPDYVRAVSDIREEPGAWVLYLNNIWLATAVEKGFSGGQMHDWLLGGPGTKVSKTGALYRSIPFRHKTVGSRNRQGLPFGQAFAPDSPNALKAAHTVLNKETRDNLGKEIYKQAKNLKPRESLPSGLAPKLRPFHSTDIYAGLIRTKQPGSGSVYNTFRTISEEVTDKWKHPGIKARNFFQSGQAYVERVAPRALQQALDSASN